MHKKLGLHASGHIHKIPSFKNLPPEMRARGDDAAFRSSMASSTTRSAKGANDRFASRKPCEYAGTDPSGPLGFPRERKLEQIFTFTPKKCGMHRYVYKFQKINPTGLRPCQAAIKKHRIP
ncbi:MAG: hypothetical protein ISN29_00605 [Gammaproteobacteria bacterium AqS3]|nr:hypothetical protein [Gammaproteobacteria bacterium AqS3]